MLTEGGETLEIGQWTHRKDNNHHNGGEQGWGPGMISLYLKYSDEISKALLSERYRRDMIAIP